MQLGEVIKSNHQAEVIPASSEYPRWYIFLAVDPSKDEGHRGLLVTTTTKIDNHKRFEPNCVLFKEGDFGFEKDCCVSTQMIFKSELDKIKKWEKKGKIDNREILIQIYSNINNNDKDIAQMYKKAIKNSYIEAGIVSR